MKKVTYLVFGFLIICQPLMATNVDLYQFNMQGQLIKANKIIISTVYVPLGIECEDKNLLIIAGDALTTSTTYYVNKKGQVAKSYSSAFGHRGITTDEKSIFNTSFYIAWDAVANFDKSGNLNNYVLFTQPHYGISKNFKNLLSPIASTGTYDIFNLKGNNFYGVKTVTVTGGSSLSSSISHRERLSFINQEASAANKLLYNDYDGKLYRTITFPYNCNIGETYIGHCTDGKNIWVVGYDAATCA